METIFIHRVVFYRKSRKKVGKMPRKGGKPREKTGFSDISSNLFGVKLSFSRKLLRCIDRMSHFGKSAENAGNPEESMGKSHENAGKSYDSAGKSHENAGKSRENAGKSRIFPRFHLNN